MKINIGSQEPDVRIELIPLIDVIFCILTFFILAAVTLTRQSGINVDIPTASSGVTQMREMLIVSVDPVGSVYVEQDPVTEDQLRERLLAFRQSQPNGVMVLYASRLASYDDVVRVLDVLRSVGGDRVALATLPETGDTGLQQSPQSIPGFDTSPGYSLPPSDPLSPVNPVNPVTPINPEFRPLPGGSQSVPGLSDPAPLSPSGSGSTLRTPPSTQP